MLSCIKYLCKYAIAVYVTYRTAITIYSIDKDPQTLALKKLNQLIFGFFSIWHFTFWCIYTPVFS